MSVERKINTASRMKTRNVYDVQPTQHVVMILSDMYAVGAKWLAAERMQIIDNIGSKSLGCGELDDPDLLALAAHDHNQTNRPYKGCVASIIAHTKHELVINLDRKVFVLAMKNQGKDFIIL